MGFKKAGQGNYGQRTSTRSGGRPSDRSDFGARPRPSSSSFGNRARPSGDGSLFSTTCAKCGKSCQVPFRPTNGKPVYCGDCFAQKDDRSSRRGKADDYSVELAEINEKLDKIMQALNIE